MPKNNSKSRKQERRQRALICVRRRLVRHDPEQTSNNDWMKWYTCGKDHILPSEWKKQTRIERWKTALVEERVLVERLGQTYRSESSVDVFTARNGHEVLEAMMDEMDF